MIKAVTTHKSLEKVERHTEEVNQITLGLSLRLDERWGTCQSRNVRFRDEPAVGFISLGNDEVMLQPSTLRTHPKRMAVSN
jgi:hypothetical protein